MKSEYTVNPVSMGPFAWMELWMPETVLAVTVVPDAQWYLVHAPVPGHALGQAATCPFPEVYGMHASVTTPVPSRYYHALLR